MKNNTFNNITRSISYNLHKKTTLNRKKNKKIPYLWFFTDSIKTINPLNTASYLPNKSGIVIRSYSSNNKEILITNAIKMKKRKLFTVLISGKYNRNIDACGTHVPKWINFKNKNKNILSMSVHTGMDIRKSINLKADIVFISPVYVSSSHKNKRCLGPVRLGLLAKLFKIPTIALGGINNKNIYRLKSLPICGCAGIDVFTNKQQKL